MSRPAARRITAAGLALATGAMAGAGSWTAPVAGLVLASGCGPECGDGEVNGGEECDDGNEDETDACRACSTYFIPRTTIKWAFNDDAERGFTGDSCGDLGVSDVLVTLTGPMTFEQTAQCSGKQAVFRDLPHGTYAVEVTPVDSGGTAKVIAPVETEVVAGAADVTVDVLVPYTAWEAAYTGTFFFRLTWGGQPCATAVPPVELQTLTLTVDGEVVTQLTDSGQHLDGSDPQACRSSTESFPQSALLVPFGPATLTVSGTAGASSFAGEFETFVGAGISNPTVTFDVALVPVGP